MAREHRLTRPSLGEASANALRSIAQINATQKKNRSDGNCQSGAL